MTGNGDEGEESALLFSVMSCSASTTRFWKVSCRAELRISVVSHLASEEVLARSSEQHVTAALLTEARVWRKKGNRRGTSSGNCDWSSSDSEVLYRALSSCITLPANQNLMHEMQTHSFRLLRGLYSFSVQNSSAGASNWNTLHDAISLRCTCLTYLLSNSKLFEIILKALGLSA